MHEDKAKWKVFAYEKKTKQGFWKDFVRFIAIPSLSPLPNKTLRGICLALLGHVWSEVGK